MLVFISSSSAMQADAISEQYGVIVMTAIVAFILGVISNLLRERYKDHLQRRRGRDNEAREEIVKHGIATCHAWITEVVVAWEALGGSQSRMLRVSCSDGPLKACVLLDSRINEQLCKSIEVAIAVIDAITSRANGKWEPDTAERKVLGQLRTIAKALEWWSTRYSASPRPSRMRLFFWQWRADRKFRLGV